jgi:type II secretory pathway component PulJ
MGVSMSREVAESVLVSAPAGRRGRTRSRSGVTLVELLVATCVTAVALTGAWAWLWNAGGTASSAAGRAQAATAAAFAVRVVADELALATAITSLPAGMPPDRAVCVQHRHDGVSAETMLVAWDPGRRVLWRKAPGMYLADHVERFAVDYFRADGRRLGPVDFAAAGWPGTVARIAVTVDVTVDGRTARASRSVALAPEAT